MCVTGPIHEKEEGIGFAVAEEEEEEEEASRSKDALTEERSTAVGKLTSRRFAAGSPHWPTSFEPKHHMSPDASNSTVCAVPHATATNQVSAPPP